MKGDGHVRLFGTLTIGHRLHEGVQRVQCFPFADMKFYGSNRMDTVFIRPPGVSDGAFRLSLDNVWFCRVLLLFSIQVRTDAGAIQMQCAMVSVMEAYDGRLRAGLHCVDVSAKNKDLTDMPARCRLGPRLRFGHGVRAGPRKPNSVCCARQLHTGKIAAGAGWRHWNHPFLRAHSAGPRVSGCLCR